MSRQNSRCDLVVVGAGGHGSELLSYLSDLAAADKEIRLLGFLDDNRAAGPWLNTKVLGGIPELTVLARQEKQRVVNYITAVGDNAVRLQMVRRIEALSLPNLRAWALRHPMAQIGRDVEIGGGTLLAPQVILTTRISIGDHCILNVRASVSHDCRIGNYVNINPAVVLCGNVTVGAGSYIGAGAVIKEDVTIGQNVVVGAGGVVIRDLPDGVTAVGVPAGVIRRQGLPS